MEATLNALGDLLIKAVPTIICFIILTFYLKHVFFKPLARVLEERKRETEGVRELALRAFESADQKTSEFHRALQLAREDIHREREAMRRQWREEQAQAIAEARAEADRKLAEAKASIHQEAESAQAQLNASIDVLSERIVNSLLQRRAA